MKLWKTLFEAGVMASGLVLVIITLSEKPKPSASSPVP
jgi:hypothetical protein